MRRFRLRRLEKVNTEALMIGAGENVKRLLAFGNRGPGRMAQAAALRLPGESCPHPVPSHRAARQCVFQQADKLRNLSVNNASIPSNDNRSFSRRCCHLRGKQRRILPNYAPTLMADLC